MQFDSANAALAPACAAVLADLILGSAENFGKQADAVYATKDVCIRAHQEEHVDWQHFGST